jgi:hypothetical protein
MNDTCDKCKKPSTSYRYVEGDWLCRHCIQQIDEGIYIKEMGVENPEDPKGSTAHVRDIKDRRWHPTEKRLFYYSKEKPKTYFFKKG